MKPNNESGERAKMAAARTLIQERRYDEAKALLRGISHPTAREWLHRLEAMPTKKRSRGAWILTCGVLGILLVGVAVFAGLFIVREQGQYTATQAAGVNATMLVSTAVSANATLEYLYQQQENEVYANLSTYCTSVGLRSQGDCRRWAEAIVEAKFPETSVCLNEYDWIRDTDNFSTCLFTQGVAVLGNEPLIPPLDPAAMTDENIATTGALIAYCDDTQSEDYCHVWAITMFLNERASVDTCDVQRISTSVFAFFSCLETLGLVP